MSTLQEDLDQIRNDMRECPEDFHLMAQHRVTLSSIYSRYSGLIKDLLPLRTTYIRNVRSEAGSEKAAERLWKETIEGQREEMLKLDLADIKQMTAALKQLIDVQRTDYYQSK